jgi:hypothetical protein
MDGEVLVATHAEIRKAILKVAGNPETGAIRDLADAMASAVVALDNEPAKENRVMKVAEKR